MSNKSEKWHLSDDRFIQALIVSPQKESVFIRLTDSSAIGKGAFGTVFRSLAHTPNSSAPEVVAVKRVLHNNKYKDREFDLMSTINHPFIVKLKYFFKVKTEVNEIFHYFIFENMACSLHDHIEERRAMSPIICFDLIKIYLSQLMQALSYIHEKNICHRDIKPQNILLDSSRRLVKLCDFGSAKILSSDSPSLYYICSRYYRAPELILGMTRYTTKIDMWSVGCVLAEMISGTPLFSAEACVGVLDMIIRVIGTPCLADINAMNPAYSSVNGEITHTVIPIGLRAKLKTYIPDDLLEVLQNLIVYNPHVRYDSLQCLQIPCIRDTLYEAAGKDQCNSNLEIALNNPSQ